MNTKRYVLATFSTFLFVFIFEFIVHGLLLKGAYMETRDLWKPQTGQGMAFMALSQYLFSAFAVYFYTRKYEGKGPVEGLRFGLILGLILFSLDLGAYSFLPIPFSLVFSWMMANLLKGIGAGLVASIVYKN
jgi:hypothetical protein